MSSVNVAAVPAAIIGSGNIGTDLLIKLIRKAQRLKLAAMVGIDPGSSGLAHAAKLGAQITADGIDGFLQLPAAKSVRIAFDATSAKAHARHAALLNERGIRVIDLTPAALGPYCVPVVNIEQHLDAPNLNMVTCGGQATIPIVQAVSRVTRVRYAEIVASIASLSAGPGTRANIDEFTETTARGIEHVGGAEHGKAIIVLNPAEPPLLMRNTIYCLTDRVPREQIERSIESTVAAVQAYVPGYRLKQRVQFDEYTADAPLNIPDMGFVTGLRTSVFLEVQGAGHYLPTYAGNLDIMTSAALAAAERIALRLQTGE